MKNDDRGSNAAGRGRFAIAVVACGAFTAACGGGGDAPSPDNIGQMFASSMCAAERRCCERAGGTPSSDSQACIALKIGVPTMYGANPSNATFNADTAAECLKAANTYDCGGSLVIEATHRLCAFVFTGQTAVGGDCSWNSDCQQPAGGHAVCVSTKCAVTNVLGRDGAPCDSTITTNTPFVCAFHEGYRCVLDITTGQATCQKRHAPGSACGTTLECLEHNYCDASAGVCAPDRKVNESCDVQFSPCGLGLTCTNGTCVQGTTC
jgi:hypothetical protein